MSRPAIIKLPTSLLYRLRKGTENLVLCEKVAGSPGS